MAMIAARQGCVAMIYPSAFNITTGPMHWTLLQRARCAIYRLTGACLFCHRAVDNQMYVAMCSTARNPGATYQAVSQPDMLATVADDLQWGHSLVVNPL